MTFGAVLIAELAYELALFSAVGLLLIAVDDLFVDLIYLVREAWRSQTIYVRVPRATADKIEEGFHPGWFAIFVPAWRESDVIAQMLRTTLNRLQHDDYRLFVGHYRNDPATAVQIASVADPRIVPVMVDDDGPTTKGDCLNRLYSELCAYEDRIERPAKAVVIHDAEDLVHPLELRLFDRMVDFAGAVQLPVIPLIDPDSRWIAGHYADEFAEAHIKDLVVREAVGAAIPLAGVGCAIERLALSRIAGRHDGKPFPASSMTEDYELGLRLGAMGIRTIFVRMRAAADGDWVATRSYFPSSLEAAVKQKARWIGGISFDGWDRLRWHGGIGERWMRLRDRRAPLSAIVLAAGYAAALLWAHLGLAASVEAARLPRLSPALHFLLTLNAGFLGWRLLLRASFTSFYHGWREGLRSVPRTIVSNLVAILAVRKALHIHSAGGARIWSKTDHIYPAPIIPG